MNLTKELEIPISSLFKSTSLEIKHLIINSQNTNVLIDTLDHMPDETIVSIVHHINMLNAHFINSISQYDFSKEAMESISKHIIEEFYFINKMNSLKETNPAVGIYFFALTHFSF